MRNTLSLEPFYKRTIGFDKLFSELENFANSSHSYPPYNIIKIDDTNYSIEIAVSGFSMDEIEIIKDRNILSVSGSKTSVDNVEYIYKGIATRNFNKQFTLADYVDVTDATIKNGVLYIQLQKNIPEQYQPKKIAITASHMIEG